MDNYFQDVCRLLGEGKTQEAEGVLSELRQTISRLREQQDICSGMIALSKNSQPGHKSTKAVLNLPKKPRKVPEDERSALIKNFARQMAEADSGRIQTGELAAKIASEGFDLGTRVPGTMIGNVLLKDENWKRIERGIYEFKGA